ncbi:DUF397 domain-containing protein [Streptomyces sp. NPDC056069]|uniref:DUF397 domain-containing protein n=1 Tax=Streptomyces sp. NPDC056069 TaxID=3345702 RepID=UPI0035E0E59B
MALTKSLDLAPRDAWFKSSYSGDSGNSCVEVADLGTAIGVRDSKEQNGPAFAVSPTAFAGFVASVNRGGFTA